MDDRITPKAPRGEHIMLTCKNHPALTWHTKNISHVGARTIFFNLMDQSNEQECDCNLSDLVLHPQYEKMPEVPE